MKLKSPSTRSKISVSSHTLYFNFYKLLSFLLYIFIPFRESNFEKCIIVAFFLRALCITCCCISHLLLLHYQHCTVTTVSGNTENSLNAKTIFFFLAVVQVFFKIFSFLFCFIAMGQRQVCLFCNVV